MLEHDYAKKGVQEMFDVDEPDNREVDHLCDFPVGVSPNVTVNLQDYKTLEYGTFLNDIIIDFYLTYLFENVLLKEDSTKVYVFSTMFYKKLTVTPTKAEANSFEKDPSLSTGQKQHMRVKGWTKKFDLFEKDMIIVPICEDNHWYLVILIKPGLIQHAVGSEERLTRGEPFFIVMDSMGDSKGTAAAVTNVKNYLAQEWKAKKVGFK
jgi:sentrin-specific protease 7